MFYRKDIAHRAFKPTAAMREALTYASAGVSIEAGNEFVTRIKKVCVSISTTSRIMELILLRLLHQLAGLALMQKLEALEAKWT
jgi:phosphoribosylaminoimidazole (AIR) synthetase